MLKNKNKNTPLIHFCLSNRCVNKDWKEDDENKTPEIVVVCF
jgi:hypothetical protein